MAICGRIIANVVLPSFIQSALYPDSKPTASKARETDYIDGLRGTVVLLVCVRHFLLPWYRDLDIGFLDGESHDSFLRLPGIRMLYSGPNVPVMLVVSGFVLSLKPLSYMESGDRTAAYKIAASSAFRRPFRLFPPPIFSTAMVACAVQLGLFNYPYETMPGHKPLHPPVLPAREQFFSWIRLVAEELTFPWTWTISSPLYGAHLWTIAMQYRCSLIITLILVLCGRMREKFRPRMFLAIIVYSFASGRWDVATYVGGSLLAERQVRRRSMTLTTMIVDKKRCTIWQHATRRLLKVCVFAVSIYAGSFPRKRGGDGAYGYRWCYWFSSDYRTWHAGAGIGFVIFAYLSKHAQSILNTRPTRYLGKISFALYIVHEPLLHLYGFNCVEWAWRLTGNSTALSYNGGLLVAFTMTMPLIIWTAEIFQRVVDVPCALASERIDKFCNTT